METILIRYCEIGLKSTPVRRKFEANLRDNILSMLASDGIEALLTMGEARIYLESEDIEGCVRSVSKVFGIASLSVCSVCNSTMDEICAAAAEYSRGRIGEGESFAVRARREGNHPFTSMEIGRDAGSAIFIANEDKHVSVDLHDPDKVIYIEVRNSTTFIFDSYIAGPGGLPMGSQGKVLAEIDGERSVVSAWTMMRRGCRVYVTGDGDDTLLRMYDPGLRRFDAETDGKLMQEFLAKVSGASIDTVSGYDYGGSDLPVFFPTVGMTDDETSDLLAHIRDVSF